MNLGDIPLFAMLKGRLGYLTDRQRVISENVANASTPGYRPSDLTPYSFHAQVRAATNASSAAAAVNPAQPRATQPNHMAGTLTPRKPGVREKMGVDSEVTLDGNGVVLEDQMIKMADARMNYDAAVGFYQKSLGLLRMAAKPPGRA